MELALRRYAPTLWKDKKYMYPVLLSGVLSSSRYFDICRNVIANILEQILQGPEIEVQIFHFILKAGV